MTSQGLVIVMLTSIFRVLFGFVLAALMAASVHVLFVHTPVELAVAVPEAGTETFADAVSFLLKIATHMAVFATPFVLIAAAVAEGLRMRGLPFYLLAGLGIAAMGLYAEFKSERPGDPTIFNLYAALAYAAAGLAGGYVYWAIAGHRAGGRRTSWDVASASAAGPVLKVGHDEEDDEVKSLEVASKVKSAQQSAAKPEAFRIELSEAQGDKPRLVAAETLTRADFQKVAERAGSKIRKARKIGFVAARQADEDEVVITEWNGKETTNTARPGDWVVTNMTAAQELLKDDEGQVNTYVIKAETFPRLYQGVDGNNEHGSLFRSVAVVDSLYLPGGFDIHAPWGERQTAERGYLIVNGEDVYGNNADTFEATYEFIQ